MTLWSSVGTYGTKAGAVAHVGRDSVVRIIKIYKHDWKEAEKLKYKKLAFGEQNPTK